MIPRVIDYQVVSALDPYRFATQVAEKLPEWQPYGPPIMDYSQNPPMLVQVMVRFAPEHSPMHKVQSIKR